MTKCLLGLNQHPVGIVNIDHVGSSFNDVVEGQFMCLCLTHFKRGLRSFQVLLNSLYRDSVNSLFLSLPASRRTETSVFFSFGS